jgi:hypothetical protein
MARLRYSAKDVGHVALDDTTADQFSGTRLDEMFDGSVEIDAFGIHQKRSTPVALHRSSKGLSTV